MKAYATTCALTLGTALWALATPAAAQHLPITAQQQATAQQVSQQGVPLDALSPNAPDSYTVQSGDTLWRISGIFLAQPWRWPELWGMNLDSIRNPHRIYPGQVLYLERNGGFARLGTQPGGTIRLSPRVRSESLNDQALPTVQMNLIEPFFSRPLVLGAGELEQAPRLVAATDERVLMGQGDMVYARGNANAQLVNPTAKPSLYRVFRNATPLKDPITQEVLGYEAHYLGQAQLLRDEKQADTAPADGVTDPIVPATMLVTVAKEEMQPGDRLVPEPPRQFSSFVPHAPSQPVDARVASIYTSTAMRYGTQHQVVAINRGANDGMEPGMVLTLVTKGRRIIDKSDPTRPTMQLPDEANGTGIVFRTFERASYVLIMDIQRGVEVGDILTNPH